MAVVGDNVYCVAEDVIPVMFSVPAPLLETTTESFFVVPVATLRKLMLPGVTAKEGVAGTVVKFHTVDQELAPPALAA